jgi:hypothetical protein
VVWRERKKGFKNEDSNHPPKPLSSKIQNHLNTPYSKSSSVRHTEAQRSTVADANFRISLRLGKVQFYSLFQKIQGCLWPMKVEQGAAVY